MLLTGCSGFIGGISAESLLRQGARAIGLMREPGKDCYLTRSGLDQRMSICSGDLGDPQYVQAAVAEHAVDAVLHLAGKAILGRGDSAEAYAINTLATHNLLEALRRHRPHAVFVLASTDMVYGPGSSRPFDERMRPRPHNPYAQSKYESELLAERYAQTHDIAVGIVRLSNVYGRGDMNFSRLVPGAIRTLLTGQRLKLRSDGQSIRDFVHVDDVVRGLLAFADALIAGRLRGDVCNLAAGQSVRVVDLVLWLLQATGRPDLAPELGPPEVGADTERRCSIAKADRHLGWSPLVNLHQGLAWTADWYNNAGFGKQGE